MVEWKATWKARCDVCLSTWHVYQTNSPERTFCPVCVPPGRTESVLHWWNVNAGEAEYESWFQEPVPSSREQRLEAALKEIITQANVVDRTVTLNFFIDGLKSGWNLAKDIRHQGLEGMTMTKPEARTCQHCGRTGGGVFSFVLSVNGKAKAGYWHTRCFAIAKQEPSTKPHYDSRPADNIRSLCRSRSRSDGDNHDCRNTVGHIG